MKIIIYINRINYINKRLRKLNNTTMYKCRVSRLSMSVKGKNAANLWKKLMRTKIIIILRLLINKCKVKRISFNIWSKI